MNRKEHLLTILAEECGEVQQCVSKYLRFGANDTWKDKPTNREHLSQEMGDIMGIYSILINEGIIDQPLPSCVENKREKIEKFLLYSKERGTLTE